jgi:hypothetical protein
MVSSVIAMAVIVGAAFVLHVGRFAPNVDVDWLLIAARRFLAGGSYLSDFDEVTPPLVLVLMAPAVLLADLVNVEPYTMFMALVCLLILLTILLSAPVIAWCLPESTGSQRGVLVAITAILAFEPGFSFGQREHLITIMLLPGLLWYAAREAGRPSPFTPTTWLCLVMAAISLLIKPYYLIIALGLLVVRLIRSRNWRAAVLDIPVGVTIAIMGLFAIMVVLVFPEYLEEARLQSETYGGYANPWLLVLELDRDAIAACCMMALLAAALPISPALRVVLRCLLLASACSLVIAVLQKKGWGYHKLPAIEFAAIGLAMGAGAMVPRLRVARERLSAFILVGVIGLFGLMLALRPIDDALAQTRVRFESEPLIKTLHRSAAGRKVMLLTPGMQAGFPGLAGVRLAARHPGQPMLPGLVKLEGGNEHDRQRAGVLRQVLIGLILADLRHYQPDFIAVDRNTDRQALPDDFDILAYFMADPAFREAWSQYELSDRVSGWDFYERKH